MRKIHRWDEADTWDYWWAGPLKSIMILIPLNKQHQQSRNYRILLCFAWLFWIKDGAGTQLVQVFTWMSFSLPLLALHRFFYLLPSWCLQKHLPPAQCHFYSISALCCCLAIFLTPRCFPKETLWVTVPLHFPSSSVETVGICVVSLLASKSKRRRTHITTS